MATEWCWTAVILDFRGADKDESKLAVALPRLVEALPRPVVVPEE